MKTSYMNLVDSKAHLFLLTYFRHPRSRDDFSDEKWEPVLHEGVEQAIVSLHQEGFLDKLDVAGHISYRYKVNELKVLLRERKLPVSGRKADLINRIIEADYDSAIELVIGLNVYQCSEKGRTTIEIFEEAEKQDREETEKSVLLNLKQGQIEEVGKIMADYRRRQVFPINLEFDWRKIYSISDKKVLELILNEKPKILQRIDQEKLPQLRIVWAMMYLFGENDPEKWLDSNFDTGLPFDSATAGRMLLFFCEK